MFKEEGEGDDKTTKGICLKLSHPYKLDLLPQNPDSSDVSVQFTRWMPFSSEYEFKIPYTAVVTLGEVEKNVLKAYEAKVEAAEKKIEEANKPAEHVYASDVSVVGAGMGFGGR